MLPAVVLSRDTAIVLLDPALQALSEKPLPPQVAIPNFFAECWRLHSRYICLTSNICGVRAQLFCEALRLCLGQLWLAQGLCC